MYKLYITAIAESLSSSSNANIRHLNIYFEWLHTKSYNFNE